MKLRAKGINCAAVLDCAICGRECRWTPADPDGYAPEKFGGWYCEPCDAYTESDVEVED